ncbi:MAG TPA: serine hydrolase domain-containing protein, partial [Thermoanaerobaculia bacterium]
EVVRRALGSKLLAEPGTRHAYSNAGYMLLAAIVEAASGKEFEAFLEDHLFRPAGMEATGFPGPEWDRKAVAPGEGREGEPYSGTPLDEPASRGWYRRGAGGLLSTAEDLYRWARALEKGTVLSRASVRKLFTPHVPESEDGASFYGYGWVVDKTTRGTKVNWHNGGWYSYYSELRLYPDEGVIAVLTANRRGEALEEAWFGMLRTLFSPPPSTMANRE